MDRITPMLSPDQLELLRRYGSEHSAAEGDALFSVGDATYPLIAIVEGEVAVLDANGDEIVRHGPSGFLGEMNLLSGQTVYLTAVATKPMRYIAVDRQVLRELLFENSSLGDLLLSTFIARREALQQRTGVGLEVIGPRTSTSTRAIVEFARRNRLPHTWHDLDRTPDAEIAELAATLTEADFPLVRLPGGTTLRSPTGGQLSRALGVGLELDQQMEVDFVVIGGGPAGLGAAVNAASEGLDTLVVEGAALGGQAGTSRRIENYLGFPAGISGNELTSRAVTQARKFGARTATPYRATSLEAGQDRHLVRLEEGNTVMAKAVLLATGADYRRLPIDDLPGYEGISVFYAAGPPEAASCGGTRLAVIGGGNSAGQAAIWLARGGALVTLLHRRGDLSETMSNYLIRDLERYGVEVRGESEIAELHGQEGELEAVTLKNGERLCFKFLFCFLGAVPCTDWLGDLVERDKHGFILTGVAAGADGMLETSIPGIFAAGDVRSGSIKRCASAVGEGSMVVRMVHDHLAGSTEQIVSQ